MSLFGGSAAGAAWLAPVATIGSMVVGGAVAVATLHGVVNSKVNTPLPTPDSVSQVGTIDYGSTAP